MGTSKILIDGVGIDLTQDTVAANKMLSGTKAHDANGDVIIGDIPSKAAQTFTPGTSAQTIGAGQYLSGAQTIQGDANLVAGNVKSGVNIFGVTGTLQPAKTEQSKTLTLGAAAPDTVTPDSGEVLSSVPVVLDTSVIKAEHIAKDVMMLGITGTHEGGGEDVAAGIIERTATSITNNHATKVSPYAFYSYSALTTVSFPVCSYIGSSAFFKCFSLTTVSFPACTFIDLCAFESCTALTTANFPACTYISASAFESCTALTTISFPECTSISNFAFQHCSALTTVSFPACTSISSSAFRNCPSLTTANFPACTYIGDCAFYYCSALTTVSFPACTLISSNVFYSCSLTTANFPACTFIGYGAFYHCSALTTVSFPVCTYISNYAFQECTALTTANFPACTSMGNGAFYYCSALTTVSFPVCSYIGSSAFQSCTALTFVVLGSTSKTTIDSYAFINTSVTSFGRGAIFVPLSLLSAYSASHSSYTFAAIESYQSIVDAFPAFSLVNWEHYTMYYYSYSGLSTTSMSQKTSSSAYVYHYSSFSLNSATGVFTVLGYSSGAYARSVASTSTYHFYLSGGTVYSLTSKTTTTYSPFSTTRYYKSLVASKVVGTEWVRTTDVQHILPDRYPDDGQVGDYDRYVKIT